VTERGRQQSLSTAVISGIGGSFFGLGIRPITSSVAAETLSLTWPTATAALVPVLFHRAVRSQPPITVGFSIFTYEEKFFGEGTFLSGNTAAQQGLLGSSIDFPERLG